MDGQLREYYNTLNRLQIERLSGEFFSMESCYINLAIVEERKERRSPEIRVVGGVPTDSPFSLTDRLRVETHDEDIQFTLPNIFEKRGGQEIPSRVFIRGRAGIGKTTLCKKIVHDFLQLRLWNDIFDRIFWLPLREIKANDKIYDLGHLICEEYLYETPGKEALAKQVWTALAKAKFHRTLFLLDGLDEVSDELSQGHKLLGSLLNLPNIIVTCRPHMPLPMTLNTNFDLELETIGFYPHQVKEYVTRYFPSDQVKSAQILSYLEKHRLVQSLMRIPALLDALCWTWDELEEDEDFQENQVQTQTMTSIYKAIETKLWGKDEAKFKCLENSEEAFRTLGCFAFAGMYSNVITFSLKHRKNFLASKNHSGILKRGYPTQGLDEMLSKLSFLRSSALSSRPSALDKRNFHFLHLTFQEYFAAHYFVCQWHANGNLELLNLTDGTRSLTSPIEFLRSNKYSIRYDLVWRFVAGLLSDGGDRNDYETAEFFRILDGKPLDLLGPAHQRILMHCLSEVQSESFSLRRELESHLSKWLIFQCKLLRDRSGVRFTNKNKLRFSSIASEIEFPGRSAIAILSENDGVKEYAFSSLSRRGHIPSEIIQEAISLLENTKSDRLALSILRMFGSVRDDLPKEAFPVIAKKIEPLKIEKFEPQAPDVGVSALYALPKKWISEEFITSKLTEMVGDDPARNLNRGLCNALGEFPLSEGTLEPLARRLKDQDGYVRVVASRILYWQLNLPPVVMKLIHEYIEFGDRQIQLVSIRALSRQSELPSYLIELLASVATKGIGGVSFNALGILFSLREPPGDLLTEVLIDIDQKAEYLEVTKVAFKFSGHRLWRKWKMSEESKRKLAGLLNHKSHHLRLLVMKQISYDSNLGEQVLQTFTECLGNHDDETNKTAIEALGCQFKLPGAIVDKVLVSLKRGKRARQAAQQVLKEWTPLPESVIEKLALYIVNADDYDDDVKIAVLMALGDQPNLSMGIIEKIEDFIGHSNTEVIEAAIRAVTNQPSMLQKVLPAIQCQIQHPVKEIRKAVIQVLGRQLVHFELLAARLKDPDEFYDLKMNAARGLQQMAELPAEDLRQMVNLCGPDTMEVRDVDWLIDVLVRQKRFHSHFLLCGDVERLFNPLLVRSFKREVAWYISNEGEGGSGLSYLEKGDAPEEAKLADRHELEAKIELARKRDNVPPVAAFSSSGSF